MTTITPIVAANCHALPAVTYISRDEARANSKWKDEQLDKAEAIIELRDKLSAIWRDEANQSTFDDVDNYRAEFGEQFEHLIENVMTEAARFYYGQAGYFK